MAVAVRCKASPLFFNNLTLLLFIIEKILPMNRSLIDILNDSELIPKGTTEKSFILHKKEPTQSAGVIDLSYDNNRRSVVRKLLKQQDSNHKHGLSSTETVIKKLDEAIQSLEHDKKQISPKVAPARSNSLSAYYDKKHSNDCKYLHYLIMHPTYFF
jgi:hypothetical protein